MPGIFSERLKRERMSRGWSQTDLANKLGTAPQNVQRWEMQDVMPRSQTLEMLARFFDKPVEWFVGVPTSESIFEKDKQLMEKSEIVQDLVERYLINDKVFIKSLHNHTVAEATEIHTLSNGIRNMKLVNTRLSRCINHSELQLHHSITNLLEDRILDFQGYCEKVDNSPGYDLVVGESYIKIVYRNFFGDKHQSLPNYFKKGTFIAIPYFPDESLPFFLVPAELFTELKKIKVENIERHDGKYLMNGDLDISDYYSNYQLENYID